MTMNAERIAELRQVSNGMATFIRTYGSFTLDSGDIVFLTDLLFILSDYEKVKVEAGKLRSWLDSANLRASVAEKGQELAEAKLVDLVASAEAQADSFAKMANEQEAELEKVKALLEAANYRYDELQGLRTDDLAKLARWRPLTEAVKQAKHLSDCAKRVEFLVTKFKHGYEGAPEELAILRAALKCKGGK